LGLPLFETLEDWGKKMLEKVPEARGEGKKSQGRRRENSSPEARGGVVGGARVNFWGSLYKRRRRDSKKNKSMACEERESSRSVWTKEVTEEPQKLERKEPKPR